MNENHPDLWKFNFSISREQLKSPSKLPLGVRDNVHRQLTKYSLSRCSIYASSRTSPHFSVAVFTCCSHEAAFTPSHLRCRSAARAPQHLRCSSRAGALHTESAGGWGPIGAHFTAAQASKSRESGFCRVSPINYAAAMNRRASSAAVANSKLCLSRPWKNKFAYLKSIGQWTRWELAARTWL